MDFWIYTLYVYFFVLAVDESFALCLMAWVARKFSLFFAGFYVFSSSYLSRAREPCLTAELWLSLNPVNIVGVVKDFVLIRFFLPLTALVNDNNIGSSTKEGAIKVRIK